MKKSRKQNSFDVVLDHFHPDSINYSGCPWIIRVNPKEVDVKFIKEEFKGIIEVDESIAHEPRLVPVRGGEFKHEHTIRVLRYNSMVYKEEADRYHDGMKALLDG